ncbi:hypothetical protein EMIT0P74_120057 [Pseudomonas sp. IT-P74]
MVASILTRVVPTDSSRHKIACLFAHRGECDDDEMCHTLEGTMRLAWKRRQPVRQRKFQGRLQGV